MKIKFSKKLNQNIIMGLIILCLIGLGLGEVLKNKEEAMGYFGIYKQNREEDIRNMASTIKHHSGH